MPYYGYQCEECGKEFEVRATMSEYSAGLQPSCTHCGADRVRRTIDLIAPPAHGVQLGGTPPPSGPCCGPSGCCG